MSKKDNISKSKKTVNLLDQADSRLDQTAVQMVLVEARITDDETPFIFFTAEATPVTLHYSKDQENPYLRCNGSNCLQCRVGRRPKNFLLLPAYNILSQSVEILRLRDSNRPGALLPQVLNILKSGKLVVTLVSKKDQWTFQVATETLKDDIDSGEQTIDSFIKRVKSESIDLASIYPLLSDKELAGITDVAKMMEVKRIFLDEGD